MTDPAPPKISLSFSTKKLGSSTKSTPINGVKRPATTLFGRHEDANDESRHQEITHFDQTAGGAINSANPTADRGPRIIPYRKRQRGFVPEVPNKEERDYTPPKEDKQIHYGLNVRAKSPEEPVADTNGEEKEKEPVAEKSLDEQAMDALLGNASADPSRTIPHAVSNEDAFRRDYDEAPPVPTEDDYDAVPVEGFGAALLRGMGWKDGQPIGKNRDKVIKEVKPVERRPALLGVGAKPAAALGIPEVGTWGEKDKGKKKDAQSYNPVVLRNKITGEEITEEELKAKLLAQRNDELDFDSKLRQEDRESRHRSDEKHTKRDRHEKFEDRDHKNERRDGDRHDERYIRDRNRDRSRDEDRYDSDRRRERSKYDKRDDGETQRGHDRYDRDRRKRRWRDSDDDRRERDRKRRNYIDDRYDSDRKRDYGKHSESRRR